MERFICVLEAAEEQMLQFLDETALKRIIEQATSNYDKLVKDQHKYAPMINEYYLNWGVAMVAIYRAFQQENVEHDSILNFLYQLTYNTTKDIFLDLSFVQMAYYLICNRVFLKQLMLNAVSIFDPTHIENILEEQEADYELEGRMEESGLAAYFQEQGVPELIPLLERLDHLIDEYADEIFTKKQKELTLEDFI